MSFCEEGHFDVDELARVSADYPVSVRQRTGWLLEHVSELLDQVVDLCALAEIVAGADRVPLLPSAGRAGAAVEPWNVVVNTDVEPDL